MTTRNIKIRRAKHDKENPYYIASRATSQDKSISYEALGMLHYILSKPDDWCVQPSELEREGSGRNRVYKLLNELIAHRYIERIYNRNDKGRVESVEYITHENPLIEKPLPENQEMDLQEVEKQEMEIGYITEYREEQSTENISHAAKARVRKPEPFYDAIAEVWHNTASGYIVSIRGMMQGNAKRGTWKDCNFDPPVTDPQEIIEFGKYMTRRMREKNITDRPTAAVTVQRWFYDFRDEQQRKVIHIANGYVPVAERTNALQFVKVVNE